MHDRRRPNIKWFAAHGVKGVFEEGPGVGPGDGTDLEELKDYVMANMLWDVSLDPDQLISEFLTGYYGTVAGPFIRLYMDTMHASVDATGYHLLACCTAPPAGVEKAYLTPMALLVSAGAFADAVTALNATADPKAAVHRERVERASMANLYTVLWRWAELRSFAVNESLAWPLPAT